MHTGVYLSQKALKVCIKPEIQKFNLAAYLWSIPCNTEDTRPVKVFCLLSSDYVYILFSIMCVN